MPVVKGRTHRVSLRYNVFRFIWYLFDFGINFGLLETIQVTSTFLLVISAQMLLMQLCLPASLCTLLVRKFLFFFAFLFQDGAHCLGTADYFDFVLDKKEIGRA